MKVIRRGRQAARVRCIECRVRVPLPPRPDGVSGVGLEIACPECETILKIGGVRVERRAAAIHSGSLAAGAGSGGGNAA